MTIDKQTIEHLAKLSRLRLNEEELALYSKNLEEIIEYADSLQTVDTTGIEPATHAIPLQNVFKEDVVVTYEKIEELLDNSPNIEEHAFKVPRILTN